MELSVAIICKNAEATIRRCVEAALQLTPHVVVTDTGSTDATVTLLQTLPVQLHTVAWEGYSANKNKAAALAPTEWILNLDADEVMDDELIRSIKSADYSNPHLMFSIKLINYLGAQPIHFGQWRNNQIIRLYHKGHHQWNTNALHERLDNKTIVVPLAGLLHHYTTPDIDSYRKKLERYALLVNEQRRAQGKSGGVKQWTSPAFNFLKNYLLRGGFLDGKAGWELAKAYAWYSHLKYR